MYARAYKYIGKSCDFVCPVSGMVRNVNEKYIERKLVEKVRERGGLAFKFVSPGADGVPDRLVLLPGKRIAFVELKSPGKMMRPLQLRQKEKIERLGFSVYCVDSVDEIGGVLDEI